VRDRRCTQRILVGKPEGWKPLERLEDDIKIGFEKVG
jgi:hypothetical protein